MPPSSLQIQRTTPSKPVTAAAAATVGFHKKPKAAEVMALPGSLARYHAHEAGQDQCCSVMVQAIAAPLSTVWSVVRCFENPQAYKKFLRSCHVIDGDGQVGTLREVQVVSGLPGASSKERLEILDDERHIISFSIVGGDHRLSSYRSVTTLHPATDSSSKATTVVVESYVADIPSGNTKEDTCVFIDTIVRCNLQSLARVSEEMAESNNNIMKKSLPRTLV